MSISRTLQVNPSLLPLTEAPLGLSSEPLAKGGCSGLDNFLLAVSRPPSSCAPLRIPSRYRYNKMGWKNLIPRAGACKCGECEQFFAYEDEDPSAWPDKVTCVMCTCP